MKKRALLFLSVAALAVAEGHIAHAQSTGPAAGGASTQAPAIAMPAPPVLLMLVRTTLVALNQANFTGNYTVLHALATPAPQAKVSPVQLGIAFTELREKHLSGAADFAAIERGAGTGTRWSAAPRRSVQNSA